MSLKLTNILLLLCAFLATSSICSCSRENHYETVPIKTLRIGLLPDRNEVEATEKYSLLFNRLAENLGIPYEIIFPQSYDAFLQLFIEGKIDLAFFGAVTFLKANKEVGAIPIVLRDIDMEFKSYFIARNGVDGVELTDFAGKRFAFGSKLSTSGHLMPRYFMKSNSIMVEEFFSAVSYSNSHTDTIRLIQEGKADVGAVNSVVYDDLLKLGKIDHGKVRIVSITPAYIDYVWAVQKQMDPSLISMIRDTFTSLVPFKSEDGKILGNAGANHFYPADISDFETLVKIAKAQGVL